MAISNFGDIVGLAKSRCNINVTTFDSIFQNGINQAYLDLSKKYPVIEKSIVIPIDGIAQLPDGVFDIVNIDPIPSGGIDRRGNYLVVDSEEEITIIYSKVPTLLVNNSDIPALDSKYWYALSSYGCYTYYLFKKKTDMAQAFLQDYITSVGMLQTKDSLNDLVENVYSDMMIEG